MIMKEELLILLLIIELSFVVVFSLFANDMICVRNTLVR